MPVSGDVAQTALAPSSTTPLPEVLPGTACPHRPGTEGTSASNLPPELHKMLQKLHTERAEISLKLEAARLERQNRAMLEELKTERLLSQLEQAQQAERRSAIQKELRRCGTAGIANATAAN